MALWGLGVLMAPLSGMVLPSIPRSTQHSEDKPSRRQGVLILLDGSLPLYPRLALAPSLALWFQIPANHQVLLLNPELFHSGQMEGN